MKLQTKINIRFLLLMLIVFSISGIVFYVVLGKVVDENINDMMNLRKTRMTQFLQSHSIAGPIYSPDNSFQIIPVSPTSKYESWKDVAKYDTQEKEYDHFRVMTFINTSRGKNYQVTISQSLLEPEDMVETILIFMTALFLLILLSLFLLNRWLSRSTWKPFYHSLSLLQTFKTEKDINTNFPSTGVKEFDQLNRTLNEMISRIKNDFNNLKEFTENASHEIQTPLSIIKSNIELLLQDDNVNKLQNSRLKIINNTVNRLSKLTRALLLLSKIENNQFIERSPIEICSLIKSKLDFMEELFILKQIRITTDFQNPLTTSMNPTLADVLLNNLLSNALKHNVINGEIKITSTSNRLIIQNTGPALSINPDKLFQRFVKQANSTESNGLGLAIAAEICNRYGFLLKYRFADGFHTLELFFSPEIQPPLL